MENKQQSATRPKIGRTTGLLALSSPSTRHGELAKKKIGREACLLATSSHPTRHGELTKEKIGRSSFLLAMASGVYLGGEQGRLKLPRMTWHKPNEKETSTRHGEQSNSRGELMQMGKLINSP